MEGMIINLFTYLFIRFSSNSFDRRMCEMLSMRLTEEFENREEDIRARDDHTSKSAEKKQAKAEKKLKKTRDETEKEKAKR